VTLSYTATAGGLASTAVATQPARNLLHTDYALVLAADDSHCVQCTAVLETTAMADKPVYCLAFVPWELWIVQLIMLPVTAGYFVKK
jgi:hypothetical protein